MTKRTNAALRRLARTERKIHVALLAGDITRAEAMDSLRQAMRTTLDEVMTVWVRAAVRQMLKETKS